MPWNPAHGTELARAGALRWCGQALICPGNLRPVIIPDKKGGPPGRCGPEPGRPCAALAAVPWRSRVQTIPPAAPDFGVGTGRFRLAFACEVALGAGYDGDSTERLWR